MPPGMGRERKGRVKGGKKFPDKSRGRFLAENLRLMSFVFLLGPKAGIDVFGVVLYSACEPGRAIGLSGSVEAQGSQLPSVSVVLNKEAESGYGLLNSIEP